MFSDKLMELAYLCKRQQELVEAIFEIEKWEYQSEAYIDTKDIFLLKKTNTRWLIINAIGNKVVGWVTRGRGDFAKLMAKWLSLSGYYTI